MRTRAVTLTEQVTQQLSAEIARGDYPLGSRLPSGRQLAERFGVSAAVIREVTEHLRAQGLVESRQGLGCMVRARTGSAGFRLPAQLAVDREEMASLYELRLELEGAAAALAALRRTKDDLDTLSDLLQGLRQRLLEPQPAADLDTSFHIAIAAATHNKYYQQLLQYLNVQLHDAVRTARSNTLRQSGLAEAVHDEHVAVFAAIEAGDPVRARAAAEAHLRGAAARLGLRLEGKGPFPAAPAPA